MTQIQKYGDIYLSRDEIADINTRNETDSIVDSAIFYRNLNDHISENQKLCELGNTYTKTHPEFKGKNKELAILGALILRMRNKKDIPYKKTFKNMLAQSIKLSFKKNLTPTPDLLVRYGKLENMIEIIEADKEKKNIISNIMAGVINLKRGNEK